MGVMEQEIIVFARDDFRSSRRRILNPLSDMRNFIVKGNAILHYCLLRIDSEPVDCEPTLP